MEGVRVLKGQGSLFGQNPIAHTNDPVTSHLAADYVTRTGKRGTHVTLVVNLVRAYPGMTACELWQLGSDPDRRELGELQEIRRRLTDADAALLVKQGPARKCRVRGSTQVTWWRGDAE